MHARRVKREPDPNVSVVPSGSGISGYKTATSPSATGLIVGTNTDSNPSNTEDFPGTSIILAPSLTTSPSPSQTPTESPVVSGASSVIPLSTVIAVCVAAFIGAGLLICFSIWFYRRSSRRPPPRVAPQQQQPLTRSQGINPAAPWIKFDDGEDRWEGRNEMSETRGPLNPVLPPLPQRATSPFSIGRPMAGGDNFGSEHDATSQSMPFSQYHPKPLGQMPLDPPRRLQDDNQSTASLEGSTGASTYLSLGTVHIESGKMSPTFNVAKITPPATASRLHQWESAEVIDPDADAQEIEFHPDPFSEKSTPTNYSLTDTVGDKRSLHNPFFNAQPGTLSRRPSNAKKLTMSIASDPFDKDELVVMPQPNFISHVPHDSSSSGETVGNGKAMQNLIAALDLPQEVIEERLRAASMQSTQSLHLSEASRYSNVMDTPVGYAIPLPETEYQEDFVH